MGFDYVDLIYANPPPDSLPIAEMVSALGELLSSGKARAWGIVNWKAGQFMEAITAASDQGLAMPCAAQLPYSLVRRDWVESPEMNEPLRASGAGLVASFAMAGGVLTGKYDAGGAGRASGQDLDPVARERGRRLRAVAAEAGVSPAALAIAFALANPAVATVLFGATSAAQIAENVQALEIDRETVLRLVETEPPVDQEARD